MDVKDIIRELKIIENDSTIAELKRQLEQLKQSK